MSMNEWLFEETARRQEARNLMLPTSARKAHAASQECKTEFTKDDVIQEVLRLQDQLTEDDLFKLRMLSCPRHAHRMVRAAHGDPVSAALQGSLGSLLLGAVAATAVFMFIGGRLRVVPLVGNTISMERRSALSTIF